MKKTLVILSLMVLPSTGRCDLWGADLPLLMEIVTNTFQTLCQLQTQTELLNDQMAGIKDRINRIQTISEVIQPSSWNKWKDPKEALDRLKIIYHTLPKEYRTEKSDLIEEELSKAMNMISRVGTDAHSAFLSGKELERRGADASPGVAQKLTASGVGSLVAMQAQNEVIQSHIVSLLAQILADANDKESRSVVNRGSSFSGFSQNLGPNERKFSTHVLQLGRSL